MTTSLSRPAPVSWLPRLAGWLLGLPAYLWIALALRFLLMAFTAHHDAYFIPWTSFPLVLGEWNLYDFLDNIRQANQTPLAQIAWAPNPPLPYFTLAGWMALLRLAGLVDFSGWEYNQYTAANLDQFARALFLIRGLHLAADLGIWALLRPMVAGVQRTTLDLVWLFSPITLLGVYVMGQTDILAALWLALALALARRSLAGGPRRMAWAAAAAISLGIGAAYKLWPLILLPLFCLLLARRGRDQLGLLAAGLIPPALAILPYLGSLAFRSWVLFGHSVSFLQVGGDWPLQQVSWFLVGWGGLHAYWLYRRGVRSFDDLWRSAFLILLLFFSLTSTWEFYWLVWWAPLLSLAVAQAVQGYLPYVYIVAHALLYCLLGWDFGAEIYQPASDLLYRVAFEGERLRDLVTVGGRPDITVKLLSASFSLFVVAGWAIFVFNLAPGWLSAAAPDRRPWNAWQAALPPALAVGYLLAIAVVAILTNRLPWSKLQASFSRAYQLDPAFFVFLLLLLSACLGLAAWSAWRKRRLPAAGAGSPPLIPE